MSAALSQDVLAAIDFLSDRNSWSNAKLWRVLNLATYAAKRHVPVGELHNKEPRRVWSKELRKVVTQ